MTQPPSSSQDNETLLERLALHLLAPPFDPQARQPHLLAGRFPASLPFDLPFPDDHQVIGSFIRNSEEMQLVLDTDLSPASVIAFYTERMQAAGWTEPEILGRRRQQERGFVHTFPHPALFKTLCKGTHGPALIVSAVEGQNNGVRTEVKLQIDTRSRNSPCRQSSEIFMDVGAHIPSLEPPAGGRQRAGGGGSHSESASTSATLTMDREIPLPILSSHYAHQLEQAGWQRTGEGSAEPMAWQTWQFQDRENEQWSGVFALLQMPAMERTYYLQILINWIDKRSHS